MKKNNLTKIDIAKELSKKTGYSVELSKILINSLLIVLISSIKKNKLNLKNIGTFRLINKSERIGRNPITKENFVITSRKSISFIASKKLLSVVNLSK
ncbi:HU family DNA-binding protein [Candidatus Pelagibacter bacterium]|nr:HU family DNA-binding protein [Candidatus Pelagibacter bacterium]